MTAYYKTTAVASKQVVTVGEISGTITCDPSYRAEYKLRLINHRKAGLYTIQTASHTINGSQIYTTTFQATTGEAQS